MLLINYLMSDSDVLGMSEAIAERETLNRTWDVVHRTRIHTEEKTHSVLLLAFN